MEDIEKELESKSIERDEVQIQEVVEEQPVKRTKKTRSAAQIAAFEKAKQKRAESIALKKKQKEEEKTIIKEEKAIIKEKVKEITEGGLRLIKEKTEPVDIPKKSQEVVREVPQVHNPREQVVNNHYYYYGVPPPQHYTEPPEKKRKPKKPRPPTPSSSESEEEYIQEPPEEPELYKKLQNFKEPEPQPQYHAPKPQLKFRFH